MLIKFLKKKFLQKTKGLISIFLFTLPFAVAAASAQSAGLESYRLCHQKEYETALGILDDLELTNLEKAIVFPEVMRYTELQDQIESTTSEIMYTLGYESMTFSIGYFQMKCIFACDVENFITKDKDLKKEFSKIDFAGKSDNKSDRLKRIQRLKNTDFQILYLKAFVKICLKKFQLEKSSQKEKIKILATAYNCGFNRPLSEIQKKSSIKCYPFGYGKSDYIYWQIAYDYFKDLPE